MRMHKALGAVLLLGSATAAAARDWSVELYGGITFGRTEDCGANTFDMDRGYALGIAVCNQGLLPGFAAGVDLMGTRALYTGVPGG